jgi:hypothetical protein
MGKRLARSDGGVRVSRAVVALIAAAVVAAATGAERAARGHTFFTSKFTWHGQVRSILQRHCGACHGSAGVAAMSFDRYEDARPWAKAIKEEVLERRMPPWAAAPGFHGLRNDPSLTAFEREVLLEWIEGGAPEGERREPSAAGSADAGGEEGDLIVSLPPRAAARVQEVALRPELGGRRWLSSWTVRAGDGGLAEVRLFAGRRLLGAWTPTSGRVALPACAGQALELPLRARLTYATAPPAAAPATLALRLAGEAPAVIASFRPLAPQGGRERIDRDLAVFGVALAEGRAVELRAGYPDGRADVLGVFGPIGAGKAAAGAAARASVDLRFVTPIELPKGSALYRDGGAIQILVGAGPLPATCAASATLSAGAPPPPSKAP